MGVRDGAIRASICIMTSAAPASGQSSASVEPAVFGWRIKRTHVLPAIIQCCIYAYWAVYWRELHGRVYGLLWLLA